MHKRDCACYLCRLERQGYSKSDLKAAFEDWGLEQLQQYGWFTEYVPLSDTTANIHTHGLELTRNHPDFQLVLPLATQVVQSIIGSLIARVDEGERFAAGQSVDKILRRFPIKLMDAQETGRAVLRILLPDSEGRFPGDMGCAPVYAEQATLDTDADPDEAIN